ncbi:MULTISPECIES: hypothetical protein [Brevibacillus]|uniref:DUF4367 domain-containing protein n=1 Tax=Brevibacillus invocatus TaxID=173959 RepID=A0A3M8BNP4_9BACL|nr:MULTISPECIES: hypothetical protein [Brevibacillus]MCM3082148.1 hypothetical protein [Brevibacillus invocatus]MCM3432578.1 hypothetical protein [Brevibacillus invocatus]MDH4618944.1 hypothetical protein [Brevibacillus sp. AY1]RNB65039.1 hypothetical protein EDM52_23890 [Brevibacillus invocatus]
MFFNKLIPIILSLSIIHSIPPKDPLNSDPSKPLGDVAPIKVSVSQFENTNKQKISLPQYIPFTPTHTGGHYNKLLQMLTIDYLNQKTNELLSISVYLKESSDKNNKPEIVTLADGTIAKYIHSDKYIADFIRFKKNNLTYEIGILKQEKGRRLDALIKVANSLQ